MSERKHPTLVRLSSVVEMEGSIKMAVGWYAGAMAIKDIEHDTLSGVELALEGWDKKVLSIVCFWKSHPTAAQEAAIAAGAEYSLGFKIPVVHVLVETGAWAGTQSGAPAILN